MPARRPRYREVADALIADISSGRLAVGSTLPGEIELTTQFGVSRHTVREALRGLEQLGLIGRRQGVGTAVLAREPQDSYIQAVRTPAALLQYPPGNRLTVLARDDVTVTRTLARLIGGRTGSAWLRLACLRGYADERPPICWLDLYLQPRFARIADLIGREPLLAYELIEREFGEGVQKVEVDLLARSVPARMADALGVAAGSPSLTVVRRYYNAAGELLQASVSEHPDQRFTYSITLERGWLADGGATWTSGGGDGR